MSKIETEFFGQPLNWHYLRHTSQAVALDTRADHTLYCGSRGPGKCLPIDTPVPTPQGWKKHGDLIAGDMVFGSDGHLAIVTRSHQHQQRKTYRLAFNDGSTIEASDNHLWAVTYDNGVPRNWRVVETEEIVARIRLGYPVRIKPRPVIQYSSHKLPIDPYILGAWIGDGSTSVRVRQPTGNRTRARFGYSIEFGTADEELVTSFYDAGFSIKRQEGFFTWLLGKFEHRDALRELGLFETKCATKFIPKEILLNDVRTRIAFLQGLADTDGTAHRSTGARISTVSPQLADDVVSLVQSLGGVARKGSYQQKSVQAQLIYNIDFSLPAHIVPFRLTRKIETYKRPERLGWFALRVVATEDLEEKLVSCIEVSAHDSLYVVGSNYIVTHNTDTQLMRFRKFVGMGYGPFWRGVIFDREYKNLDDLVTKSKRWFYGDIMQPRFLESKADYRWVWPTGEELLFRTLKTADDYWNYHGHEYPFIGWNELCKFPSRQLYDDIMSCNRSSFISEKDTPNHRITYRDKNDEIQVSCDREKGIFLKPIPMCVFSTTNSYGPGRAWVKKQFIDPVPYGKSLKWTTNVFNPRTKQRENIVKSQIAFFGSYRENPFLDPKYVADLENIKDINKRKSWLMGDWNITSGGALDDLWDNDIHVVPRFKVPKGWRLDRTFDWGSTAPFAVTWWAETDGEEVTRDDGSKWCPHKGSLVCFGDYYGCDKGLSNVGMKMQPRQIALNIIEREKAMLQDGWIVSTPYGGPADNQIRDVTRKDIETIEKVMADAGIHWTASDKSPGSRRVGLEMLRSRLEASIKNERPGIYFMDCCRDTIATVPVLPRDPDKLDDVDTDAEDHLYDTVRYRVLKGSNRLPKTVPKFFG